MSVEMKLGLSVCRSYLDPNMRGQMKCSLSVFLWSKYEEREKWLSSWSESKRSRVPFLVSILEIGYFLLASRDMAEISLKWLKSSIQPIWVKWNVRLTWISIWGMKKLSVFLWSQYWGWNYVCLKNYLDSNIRIKWNLVCLTVCLTWIPNMWSEMKRSLSFCYIDSHVGWNETYFVRMFVLRRFQY